MNIETTILHRQINFRDFLLNNRSHRIILVFATISVVLQFIVFKYFYPYASFIHDDSFVYLDAAYNNWDINTYMIGYSRFLRLFSVFTNSDTALVAFQYFLLQASSFFLLFTLLYFYKPSPFVQKTLFLCVLFNPLFLYLSNLISSDALFAALSLIWFTLLLWIIHRLNIKLIIWHSAMIFILFTIRYNALIYLPISIMAFLLSPRSRWLKTLGISSSTVAIALFVIYTGNQYKALTGNWQYSPFAGWQLANNAMYIYRYVDSASRKPVPKQFQSLDNMIRLYYDSTRDIQKFPVEAQMASTAYMWSSALPLMKYQDSLYKNNSNFSLLKKWALMGPLYKDYGLFIINKYPVHFVKYFLWPNAKNYYSPPLEYLGDYNCGKFTVDVTAKIWFKYKNQRVATRTKNLKAETLRFFPILSAIANVIMLFGLMSFLFLTELRADNLFNKGFLLIGTIWILNACFTIFASSVALRFQTFPIILTCINVGVIVDRITKISIPSTVQIKLNEEKASKKVFQ